MAENSKIEWTVHTANAWWGCTQVGPGCDHCYAKTLANRWGFDLWGNDKPRMIVNKFWSDLQRFQKIAAAAGRIDGVFIDSMMDIFEKPMPLVNRKQEAIEHTDTGEVRKILFHAISSGKYDNLDFMMLTKRPSNINRMIYPSWKDHPLKNVRYGTSPVNQATFDNYVMKHLMKVNGRLFLSIEPQIDHITLHPDIVGKIGWIIQGGESGHHRRPFNLDWAYSMKDQCAKLGIPYFFKQIDKVRPIPTDLMVREFPKD